MYSKFANETAQTVMDVPKAFWQYYDLYRRDEISLAQYSAHAGLREDEILRYLSII